MVNTNSGFRVACANLANSAFQCDDVIWQKFSQKFESEAADVVPLKLGGTTVHRAPS
jgi:hypothetical protein